MCCKQLIKTDTQISLSALNNIDNEIRKARLRLHKVEDKENMHFLTRIVSCIWTFERIGKNLNSQTSQNLHRALYYNSKRNALKVTSDRNIS
jgi:hypothetical protein